MVETRSGLTRKLNALRSRLAGPATASHEGNENPMAEKAKKKTDDKDAGPARSGEGPTTAKKKAVASKASSPAGGSKSKGGADAKSKSSGSAGAKSKSSAKASGGSGSGGGKASRKKSGGRESVATKTKEVVGEMLAGAAVGAVTAAAASVEGASTSAEQAATDLKRGKSSGGSKASGKRSTRAKSPTEVLGEMATPAAIGAVAGAAKAVLPKKGKGSSKRKGGE